MRCDESEGRTLATRELAVVPMLELSDDLFPAPASLRRDGLRGGVQADHPRELPEDH